MATAHEHETSTGRLGRRVVSAAAGLLLASVAVTLVPTAASAFNIEGLIGGALALRYGGYHGGSSHHVKSHESRRDHDSTDRGRNSAGKEKDAREVDATDEGGKSGGKAESKPDSKVVAHRQPSGSGGNTQQASETDASVGKMTADEPAFAPSR